ncbi:MAG: extracellular solute-binding protein [Microcystis wesenbergii Mw_MB_S_20031200_S109]|uniref:Extracellular solute-binding protein n=1 Tax=Microcystis wesenbergii Mw_MB_S_20031200_S109D TaxID=2486241 RepID=A0A552LCU6_9CHRO|nr:MAG: extracellular solute-binding protein [Microcystis wesenbergii Mw_MB_S_20031200_S109]TRV18035.1 MAG: extracellular solute-binding protein [Microcystis wesenbergii Mw_MB_S_20031200_S109D]
MQSLMLRVTTAWRSKKLRRIISLLLLFILMPIFLYACFSDLPNQSSEQRQGTLLVWYPEEGNLTKLVGLGLQEFEKLNPQVTILEQAIPIDEIPERFLKQSQSGLGASVILIFSRNIPRLVSQGVLEEIDQNNLDLSIYYPPTLKQVSYQGKIYGIPLGSRTNVLCYNQKKLQVSTDPLLKQPPSSLGGLVERARKGYSVGIVSSFEDTFWGMAIFGGYLWDDQGRLQPRLDGWAKWLEWLKFASSQPNFILNRQRELLHEAFARGRLTYYVCNSIEIADLKNSLQDDLRVALLPQDTQGKAAPILYTRVMVFNRNNSDNENRLGLALGKFLTNPEQQLQAIIQTESFIPTNRRVQIEGNLLPIESVLLQQSQNAVAVPLDDWEKLNKILEEGEFWYERAIAGEISSSKAAHQLTLYIQSDLDQEVKKIN